MKKIVAFCVLFLVAHPLCAALGGPQDIVLDYYAYLVHKDEASLLQLCRLSDVKTKELRESLVPYMGPDQWLGIVPQIIKLDQHHEKASVLVDTKVAIFDLGDAAYERHALRTLFELSFDPTSQLWQIRDIYSRAIEWPIPGVVDERITSLTNVSNQADVLKQLKDIELEYPRIAELYQFRALQYRSFNQIDEAMEALKTSIEIEPWHYGAHGIYADLLYKSGDTMGALHSASIAERFCPVMQNPNMHVMLGYIFLAGGEEAKGLEQWQWYIRREPKGLYAPTVQSFITEIQRMQAESAPLHIYVTVDGQVPRHSRLSLFAHDTQELLDVSLTGQLLVQAHPGMYDIQCEIQDLSFWKREVSMHPYQQHEEHFDVQTGILKVDVYQRDHLPVLDATVYVFRHGEKNHLQQLSDYRAELRLLPGTYDVVITAPSKGIEYRKEAILVKSNDVVHIKYRSEDHK